MWDAFFFYSENLFQTFALINKQVANQPIEICFSKGDQKKKKRNALGSSFRVLFFRHHLKAALPNRFPLKWLLSVFLSFFFFFLAFHFCCSLTRLSQQCQKGPDLPKTAAVNEIQPLIRVFLPRLGWVYFAILKRWLLFQSALSLISQLSKAAKFVLAVFSFWAFSGQVFQLFLSCPVWYPGINTPQHTHTYAGLSRMLGSMLLACD